MNDNANETYLSLPTDKLQQSTDKLKTILADSMFMYQLYKKHHWHVTGEDFYQYHLLFDKHAGELLPLVDLIAERLRTLGTIAPGMPQDVVANASLSDTSTDTMTPQDRVKALLNAHDQFIDALRKTIAICNENEDEGTSDLLVSDILRVHELQVWFLRSSLAAA